MNRGHFGRVILHVRRLVHFVFPQEIGIDAAVFDRTPDICLRRPVAEFRVPVANERHVFERRIEPRLFDLYVFKFHETLEGRDCRLHDLSNLCIQLIA